MSPTRKLIDFDPETRLALELLSRDSGKSFQQLADEAFSDLLAKHHRPRTLKDALKQSSQPVPATPAVARAAPAPEGAATVPRFESAPCPATQVKALANAHCGYLVAPEDRSRPAARSIRLIVAIRLAFCGRAYLINRLCHLNDH